MYCIKNASETFAVKKQSGCSMGTSVHSECIACLSAINTIAMIAKISLNVWGVGAFLHKLQSDCHM
jgi:hypothetical protein